MPARLLVLCLAALLAGCGRQPATSPAPAEPASPATAPATEPATATPRPESSAQTPDDAQMAAILGELTQVVRKYSVERRSVPKTLEELVAGGYLSRAPEAPAGKQFVISRDLRVELVKK